MKFLLRYPEQSVELFLSDGKVQDQQWNRFFEVLTDCVVWFHTFPWSRASMRVPGAGEQAGSISSPDGVKGP